MFRPRTTPTGSLFAAAPALDLRAFLAREAPEHLPTLDDLVHRTADGIRLREALYRETQSFLVPYCKGGTQTCEDCRGSCGIEEHQELLDSLIEWWQQR